MKKIEVYFMNRLRELRALADRGDPWVFLCASSCIEYLAKLVYGKSTTNQDYKDFLTDYFFTVCPEYGAFRYASGTSDLAAQMYHVLRCGVIHSFSLIADPQAKKPSVGGRDRSILLAHRKNGAVHLTPCVNNRTKPKIDAVIFTAEDFVEDIERVTRFIFKRARKRSFTGQRLRKNIRAWTDRYPPIMGLPGLKCWNLEAARNSMKSMSKLTSP